MANGNFSNSGRNTFDPAKRYIGIRMQQGVPLLDRDWNELEDIRRYFEQMLRQNYLGQGVPDDSSFQITAPSFPAPDDFLINPGRCMVNGYDLFNAAILLYSQQPGIPPLPPADKDDILHVYIKSDVVRIDSSLDPDLKNSQDINLETCVRDKLAWSVQVARHPQLPPTESYLLADIHRPNGQRTITPDMIQDLRRTRLNLAGLDDRMLTCEASLADVNTRLRNVQLDLDTVKQQLARLFWNVDLQASIPDAYFGHSVTITATIVDGLERPVSGAQLSFSTDWGALDPSLAVTGTDGKASVQLIGVHSEAVPPKNDVSILQKVVSKVSSASLPGGAIQHSQLRFETPELSMISRYSPASSLVDLAPHLPPAAIVALPLAKTATVTVHSKEGQTAVVRGTGSIQVRFGMWVRDWAMTKIVDIISKVQVGARIGDVMRQGFVNPTTYDHTVVISKLPPLLQAIHDDTNRNFKASVLRDAGTPDEQLAQVGTLGQTIAQEATAAIGSQTNDAIGNQLAQFNQDQPTVVDATKAKTASTMITQSASQIAAGFAQSHKQRFNSSRFSR